jgi:hypothetical protein
MIRCILPVTCFTIHFPSQFVKQQKFSIFVSPFCILNYTSLGHQLRILSTATVNVVINVLVCYIKLLHVSCVKLSHICIIYTVLSGAFDRRHYHIFLNKHKVSSQRLILPPFISYIKVLVASERRSLFFSYSDLPNQHDGHRLTNLKNKKY